VLRGATKWGDPKNFRDHAGSWRPTSPKALSYAKSPADQARAKIAILAQNDYFGRD